MGASTAINQAALYSVFLGLTGLSDILQSIEFRL